MKKKKTLDVGRSVQGVWSPISKEVGRYLKGGGHALVLVRVNFLIRAQEDTRESDWTEIGAVRSFSVNDYAYLYGCGKPIYPGLYAVVAIRKVLQMVFIWSFLFFSQHPRAAL